MLSWLELIWWVLWMAGIGAAIGSFANVLIYRLPRGPIFRPAWSFCPHCERRILFRDNIPLYSFLARRGRCRHCRGPISLRYPLIEAVTILAFLLVFDAMFVTAVRPDITDATGITERLAVAWPMLLAHLVLVGGLIVISVIDLEEYWVDLRMIMVIAVAGIVCHTLWSSGGDGAWQPPGPTPAAVAFGAVVGLGVARVWLWLMGQGQTSQAETQPDEADTAAPPACPPLDTPPEQSPPEQTTQQPPGAESDASPGTGPRLVAGWAIALVTLAAAATVVVGHLSELDALGFWRRSAGVLLLLFLAQLVGSARRRAADVAIVATIEQERHSARGMAARELALLLPAVVLGGLAGYGARLGFWSGFDWPAAYHWSPTSGWLPVAGLARSLCGALIAGGVGWAVRIGFTLLLGREAFGLGDVYLMAAAAAVTGWAVAVLGFFVATIFAALGVVLLLVFKRSRAIPFGPWLSMGMVAVIIAYEPIRRFLSPGLHGLAVLTGLSSQLPPF